MISSDWGSQIFLKKFCGENLSQIGQNQAWKYVSYHFLKLGWLVSLEIAFSDSLQPCVTSSRGKIHEKKIWGPSLGQRGQIRAWNFLAQIWAKIIFSVLNIVERPLKLACCDYIIYLWLFEEIRIKLFCKTNYEFFWLTVLFSFWKIKSHFCYHVVKYQFSRDNWKHSIVCWCLDNR